MTVLTRVFVLGLCFLQWRFAKVKFCMHGLNLVLSSLFYPLIRKCALAWQLLLSCVSIVFSPFLLPHLCESPALFFLLFLSCDNSSSAYPASAHSPVLKTDGSVHGVGTQTLSRAPAFLLQTLERSINSMSSSLCVRLCVCRYDNCVHFSVGKVLLYCHGGWEWCRNG